MTEELNHIYVLSGLGADEKVFKHLQLPDNHFHINWIKNLPNEPLEQYAKRMALFIKHPNPILIGLSFGGIVAQEIAKIIPVKHIILISSIKNTHEIPRHLLVFKWMQLIPLVPNFLLTKTSWLTFWIFSLKSVESKSLMTYYMNHVNPKHLRWAFTQILGWKQNKSLSNLSHIHSKGDRALTPGRIKADNWVDGGHLAVFTNPKAVQAELNVVLNSIS